METMHFRFWCPTHNTFLAGIPMFTAEFPRDEGTAFLIDLSDMYCPSIEAERAELGGDTDCQLKWEIQHATYRTLQNGKPQDEEEEDETGYDSAGVIG